jgi:dihydrofolate synthase/folylpolyglutamate synthase
VRDYDPVLEQDFFAVFQDYLNLEENTSRKYTAAEYSLAHMDELAAIAGNPESELRIIHVAGTKGKGSTCMFLAALLKAAGLRTGCFTSPHLSTVRERFLIDGELIDYALLIRIAAALEREVRRHRLEVTFFELMTVLGLQVFAATGCEYAVLETGIGGVLDSTNYIRHPVCTVITAVSYDHTQLLGSEIEGIAAQKAGIIKAGVPVVCGRQPFPAAKRVIREHAHRYSAELYDAARELPPDWQLPGLPSFLAENFAVALETCHVLGIEPQRSRFQMPTLRGRFECICRDPLVVIDVAHNVDSVSRLVDALRESYAGVLFTCVLGVVAGKDAAGIFRELCRLSCEFILTNPRLSAKGSELTQLVELAAKSGVTYRIVPEIRSLDDLPSHRPLLFTGSFFTAAIGEELFGNDLGGKLK